MDTNQPQQPQMPMPTMQEIEAVCRPPALRFSKEIIEFANGKFKALANFWAPLVCKYTTQNILLLCFLESFEAGSEDGLTAIQTYFDSMKTDACRQWQSEAFLKQFKKPKKASLILAPDARREHV